MSIFIISVISAIILAAILYFAAFHVSPWILLTPFRSPRIDPTSTPERHLLRADPFDFHTDDGFLIRGLFVHAEGEQRARGTVFCLHGIGSCKEQLLGDAKILSNQGFHVILHDFRGQGKSEGKYCTYGHLETRDLRRALDVALERFSAIGPFGVFGESYGGAVALQALARETRLTFGIVLCTFASLREISIDYVRLYTGFRFPSFTNFVLNRAGRQAGFAPDAIAPAEDARTVTQPILLIHGTADRNIAVAYGERIFANLASPMKTWFAVTGADHYNVREKAGADYKRHILEFLNRVSP